MIWWLVWLILCVFGPAWSALAWFIGGWFALAEKERSRG